MAAGIIEETALQPHVVTQLELSVVHCGFGLVPLELENAAGIIVSSAKTVAHLEATLATRTRKDAIWGVLAGKDAAVKDALQVLRNRGVGLLASGAIVELTDAVGKDLACSLSDIAPSHTALTTQSIIASVETLVFATLWGESGPRDQARLHSAGGAVAGRWLAESGRTEWRGASDALWTVASRWRLGLRLHADGSLCKHVDGEGQCCDQFLDMFGDHSWPFRVCVPHCPC